MNAENSSPTAIDLFCGCGGLTLGLKQAGFSLLGAVDIDPLSVDTYRVNHNEVFVWEEDIQDLSVAKVKKALRLRKGQLDLLAGCPPCQGFSSIRRLNGGRRILDERNDLVLDFLRFVEGLRPRIVMMENVPRLDTDRRMQRFRQRLRELGYEARRGILNAADYGVPQRRRRMIYLASRLGRVDFDEPDTRDKRGSVRSAIGHMPKPGCSQDPLHDLPESRSEKVMDFIRSIPKNGGSRTALDKTQQLDCHRDFDGFKDVYGRMAWDDIAPTITGGCVNPSKGRFLHPQEDRAITLREAALLQGFPHDYYFSLECGKYAAAQMIGNALPPEFIRRHAAQIIKHLAGER